MKNKLISGILCFCVLLSSIGCGADTEDKVQIENIVQAESTVQPEDNVKADVITENNQREQTQAQPEECDYYEELISAARECAVKNNGEKPESYDFSSMLYMQKDWDYGTLGYLIKDIDGSGTDELIFGGNADESTAWYDGIIYDIYTISDGKLVHVLDGWERSRYFLCENGIIAHEGAGSAFDGTNSYFTLEGAELHLVESVTWNYDKERDANVYYYTTESEYDTENAEIISAKQSDAIIEKYVYEHIAFIPFAENN